MATRKPTTPTPFDFTTLGNAVVAAEIPTTVRIRTAKDNPVLDAVSAASGGVWYDLPAVPAELRKDVYNMLRRAAKTLMIGLSLHDRENPDGTITWQFRVGEKSTRKRTYTDADVREWAEASGYSGEYLYPRIHKDVRDAFKDARNA
jgi:hypothetical protein